MGFYQRAGKRLFDVAVAAPLLLATAPALAASAVAVAATTGTPVLFRQRRPGLHGAPFEIWKLRTMSDARDAAGTLLSDAERLTRVGAFLRKASLDELPQLWCVLKGDMSLIGPRPLLMQYLDRYSPEQARRHDVKPGITGWAQVNGRNAISWDEKFALDVWYVDHVSFAVDVDILWRTAKKVLARSDTSAAAHATMPEFMGASTPSTSSTSSTSSTQAAA